VSTSYIERIEISNPQRLRSYTAMFLLPLGYMPSLVWCIENLFYTHSCWYPLYRNVGQIGTSSTFQIGWNNKSYFYQFCNALKYSKRSTKLMKHTRFIFYSEYVLTHTSFFNVLTSLFTQSLGCYRSRL
jgi:hypothetical protein